MIDLQMKKTCFFTGHRILPAAKREKITSLLERSIIDKYNEGITDFISGGAMGFDTLAAQVVIRLKNMEQYHNMRLLLYVPCYSFGENWNYSDRCILYKLKCNADLFEVITKVQYSDDCLRIRNEKMVTDSCCGIAYKTTNHSGTGQTLAMAKVQEKPIINLAVYFSKTKNNI